MASFLYDLVKPYVEKFVNGAIAEAHHVFCFTCIVKEFEEERAKLEPERGTMVQRVKVAKERDKDIQANVGSWTEEIDKLNQVDTKSKQTCFFGFCPDCIWRYKTGKELTNKVKRIKELKEKGEKLENIELSRCLPDAERYSSKDYISFESRESKYKELLDALKDDNNYITGLQGMGGTGKTTLAKEVGKELKQSEQFAYVVDTSVSFTPDVKKIQDDIAGSLGLKWEDCNESDRHKKLWSRLTNGDKILVILDDVWDRGPHLDFEAIGIPKRDNHKGCRVLVTSRSKKTFNIMDCEKIIELDLLSEEDAWIMFEWYAGICNSSSKILINKAREIAKECKQLPVAISVIASSLKGQQNREHEWDVTLKSLKQPASMHGVDDDMVGIYNCLKISYDNLKDKEAKGLFLLCSVFQEDEKISIEVLTRLCIGVGLFGEDYGSYDDARNQVVVAKNKLADSCLLLEVNKKHVKMHDLVRDAAQWIANKEIHCIKLFDKKQKSLVKNQTNIKHLLCEGKCMDFFNLKFDGSKLETLIVKVDRDDDRKCIKVPNSFFENVIKLRVLSFSGNYQRPLSLPDSIRSLTNIRSVLVNSVDLGDISILGKLQSLETLELVECKIEELPDQIAELRKFKLLRLKSCKIRMNNPFEVIERCSSLEELYFIDSFNKFCQEINLPELQRYQINTGNKQSLYSSTMDRIKFPNQVVFCDDEECQLSDETLKYCMQTADALCLGTVINREWRNLMPKMVSVEHGMNDLVQLHLGGISQLQCLVDTIGSQVPNVLSKLAVLELAEMENLEELFNGPLSFESLNNLEKLLINDCKHLQSLFKGKLNLCNLKTIKLKNCPMLVSLFEVSTSQSLVLLETLEMCKCEGLETIIAEERREIEEIEDSGNNNKIHGSMFSKLKVINIEKCHRLESILSFLSAQDLPVLEFIRIEQCHGLKFVFGQSQHVDLVSLTKLQLFDLPKFIGIFEESNHPMSSCVKGPSSTSKAQIQLDPIKCNIFSCCQTKPHDCSVASESKFSRDHDTGDNNWVNVFPKLKMISVMFCAQLEYIIFGPKTNDHQNHMEVQLHFPELRKLDLWYLPSLVAMCPKQYRTTFPSLESIILKECSQVDIKSIGDLIIDSVSESRDNTIIKELSGNVDHFLNLQDILLSNNCKVENIFSLNEIIDGQQQQQQLDLSLQKIELSNLPMLTCLFVGPKYSFALKNLKRIEIVGCDKLKIAFSTSIVRFLPQLNDLKIEDCKELEHIIEDDDDDDLENKKNSNSLSSTTCFPKLELLAVIKCNKLKFVFPFSVCKELPKLDVLVITEANELEEIFKSEHDQKVDIPNLNILAFDMLPSIRDAQGNQFQAVKNRFVRNCQKLTLNSASTTNIFKEIYHDLYSIDSELSLKVKRLFKQLPSAETTKVFDAGIGIQTTVEHESVCTQIQTKQTPEAEHEFVETDTIVVKPSVVNNLEGSTSEKTALATTSTILGTKNEPPIQVVPPKQKIQLKQTIEVEHKFVENVPDLAILPTNSEELLNELSMDHQDSLVETNTIVKPSQVNNLEGSTSEKTAVATVSTISETKNEPPIQVVTSEQKGIEIEGTSKTNNDQVSLNDDAFMKVDSNAEEQFSKDYEIIVSKSKASPSIPSPIASQFPSKGDPSQNVEDISSSLLVKRELEELIYKNHLDHENLSLLIDFLVKNPSVRLKDTSLGNIYKGCAYNLLTKFLKFLETHSLLEVSGSCHSEFLELLHGARNFAFDKDWLDGVERRALFPEIQVSQDALEKLLDSKKRVTKDVEDLKHQLTSSEAVLESIIQQESVLRAPIGYC